MHAISNPLSPGNGDLRVVLSGHFCASLHVGHVRSIRPGFNYRITGVEAQIKTNKQIFGSGVSISLNCRIAAGCVRLSWQCVPVPMPAVPVRG